MKSFLTFLGLVLFFLSGLLTCTGHIQKFVHFSGEVNEMAFALLSFTMASLLLATLLIPDKPKSE